MAVRSVKKSAAPELKHNPPWREVLIAMKSPSISLGLVFERMGLSSSRQYWLRRAPDLRISVASQMALAAGIDPGRFMAAVAQSQGIPGLQAVSPTRGRKVAKLKPLRRRQRCSLCGKPGHNRRMCRSQISSDALLLRARGAAMASEEKGK